MGARLPVIVAMCLAFSSPLQARELSLRYDGYYLVFRVISIDAVSSVEPAAYRTNVTMRTTGLLNAFGRWQSTATATGAVDGALLRPAFYGASSEFRDRRQRVALEYDRSGSVRADVEGMLTDGERDDVPVLLRDGTVDPLTATVTLPRRIVTTGTCAGIIRVFDGLRRYNLRYEDLGSVELEPSSRDDYQGTARYCRATVEPLAGFVRSGEGAGEAATEMSVWLAPPVPGSPPVAVRIDLTSARGTLHLHLARVGG
ncbi:MAG TPA: DUF3108 domain-containing protein [Candidatus Binatia bacterium]|nr:DUF3108 domain-containing protein [Candidatus Binatia bacterium]